MPRRPASAALWHASLASCLVTLAACSAPLPKAASHWATVNGHVLYYETGGSSTGQPILLLHGGGSSIRGSFHAQLAALGKAHPVIAIEQVGQGHTPDVPGPLSYTGMTEDTAALLTQLDLPPVDVVGYSDGGIIALMLAVHHPAQVRRLVVSGANLDPSGLTDEDLAEMQSQEPADPDTDDTPGDDKGDLLENGGEPVALSEKLRQLWLHSPTPDQLSPEMLHAVQKPVLVMAGEHDAIRLEHTQQIAQSLPQARLWILPNTGHATFSERPRWVNAALLRFLDAR